MHATAQEDINDLLVDGYEVDDDRHPSPKNKPSDRGKDTEQPIYKYEWAWHGIDHRRAAGR